MVPGEGGGDGDRVCDKGEGITASRSLLWREEDDSIV